MSNFGATWSPFIAIERLQLLKRQGLGLRPSGVTEVEDRSVSRAAEREGFHPGVAVVEVDGTCAACWQVN